MSSEEEKKKWQEMEEQRLLRIHKEEIKPFYERMAEYSRTEIDVMRGITYGLILGIFGNFLVQYSFALLEGGFPARYDNLFFGSVGVLVFSIIVILMTMYSFRKQRKEQQRKLEAALDAITKEKHEIDAREVVLEARKKGLLDSD